MKKIATIISFSFALISAPVIAQNVTYACQFAESAGLVWDNKRWAVSKFFLKNPFFLTASNAKLNVDSVGKALGKSTTTDLRCNDPDSLGTQSCGDSLGGHLIFDFGSMNGGISQIFGASMSDVFSKKDSVSVSTFTCTKM
jgi:hypothetical protein